MPLLRNDFTSCIYPHFPLLRVRASFFIPEGISNNKDFGRVWGEYMRKRHEQADYKLLDRIAQMGSEDTGKSWVGRGFFEGFGIPDGMVNVCTLHEIAKDSMIRRFDVVNLSRGKNGDLWRPVMNARRKGMFPYGIDLIEDPSHMLSISRYSAAFVHSKPLWGGGRVIRFYCSDRFAKDPNYNDLIQRLKEKFPISNIHPLNRRSCYPFPRLLK